MDTQVELLTIIVQPVFLYDNPGSDIAFNCFQPFLYNQALPCVVLKPSGREGFTWALPPRIISYETVPNHTKLSAKKKVPFCRK